MSIGVTYLTKTKENLLNRLENFRERLVEAEQEVEAMKTQIRTCTSDIDGVNLDIAKLKGEAQ